MGAGLVVAAVLPLLQVGAADERSRMTVPALSVFQSMLRFADAGESEKVQRSLAVLAPVLADHERVIGQVQHSSLLEALADADRSTLRRAVQALVARDVLVLLLNVRAGPAQRARTLVRTASLEWGLLEGVALQQDLRVAESVSARLRDVGNAVDAGDLEDAAALASKLEKDLSALFPAPTRGS